MRILVYGAGVQGCELAHRLLQNKKECRHHAGAGRVEGEARPKGPRHPPLGAVPHYGGPGGHHRHAGPGRLLRPRFRDDAGRAAARRAAHPQAEQERILRLRGQRPHAVEVMQAMQRPADKIAFGFQSSGGHRDVDKVVSAHVGVDMTIGGATAPLSGVFRYRVKTAFEGAKYKLTFVSDMDGWLKCHLALILPACYLCYACSGDLSKATKEQRGLVLDAAWEACEMLKAAHIPVDDKENTDCYRAGTPGRRKMDAMVLALCKTPLGRLCVSDHAMHAVAEMQYLDEAFEGLRTRTSVRMTAWDTLRSQMPSWDIMRKKTAKAKR